MYLNFVKLFQDKTGMDKLSFLYSVDFEQISILKQALIESGIWKSKLAIDNEEITCDGVIDINKTRFVKNFFDKREQHLAENMEIEIYNFSKIHAKPPGFDVVVFVTRSTSSSPENITYIKFHPFLKLQSNIAVALIYSLSIGVFPVMSTSLSI